MCDEKKTEITRPFKNQYIRYSASLFQRIDKLKNEIP